MFGLLTDVTLLFGNQDLSGDTNNWNMPASSEVKECTTGASGGWKEFGAGLKSAKATFEGFREPEPDGALFDAADDTPLALSKTYPIAEADVAWMAKTVKAKLDLKEQIGEFASFSVDFEVSQELVRAVALSVFDAQATGGRPAQTLGAVTAAQKVYAQQHILSVSGTNPTLDTMVESDGADDWAGLETARITFDQETDLTAGFQRKVISGPITDDWWRGMFTVGGTNNPLFRVRLIVGIQ